jgi:hypothetical protein
MPTNVAKVNENDLTVLRANDCIAGAGRERPIAQLFDEFWREGELALMFGAAGTGKSLLAVQIADALARGTPMHGFVMPRGRRKVLYIDLSLSDAQFRLRYLSAGRSGDTLVAMSPQGENLSNAEAASVATGVSPLRRTLRFKFPQNLYRGRPGHEKDLCDWIRAAVEKHVFRVVVVDDLSAIKRTHDGIRESLALMRGLKRLCGEAGISVLVLSDALEPKDGWACEEDLKRSRVLCTVADSVFCIGRTRRPENGARIFQTRSRGARVFWTSENAPVGEIKRLGSGLLGFEFDERFEPEMDPEKRDLILNVKSMHDGGASYRDIAAMLGISKTWACSLYRKWTPAMQCTMEEEDEDDEEYWDETDISDTAGAGPDEERCQKPACEQGHLDGADIDALTYVRASDTKTSDIAGGTDPAPRSIYDLEMDHNAYHDPIYVESRCEHTRKPMVWYQQFPEGTRRFQRGAFSIQVQHLNAGPFL